MFVSNRSEAYCQRTFPQAHTYFQDLSSAELLLTVVCCVLYLLILFLFGLHAHAIKHYVADEHRASIMKKLIGVFPICGGCSVIAITVPATANIMNVVIPCYLTEALHAFLHLIANLYGGHKQMSQKLMATGMYLRLGCSCWQSIPTKFLPQIKPTTRNLSILEFCVVQAAVFDIAFALIIFVGIADGFDMHHANPVLRLAKIASALFGIGACFVFADITHRVIRIKYRAQQILIVVQLLLIMLLCQEALFGLLADFHIIANEENSISPDIKAFIHNNQLLIIEHVLVSLWCTWYFRPANCALFNLYPCNKDGSMRRPSTAPATQRTQSMVERRQFVIENRQVLLGSDGAAGHRSSHSLTDLSHRHRAVDDNDVTVTPALDRWDREDRPDEPDHDEPVDNRDDRLPNVDENHEEEEEEEGEDKQHDLLVFTVSGGAADDNLPE